MENTPRFLQKANTAYRERLQNIIVLSGDIHGLYQSEITKTYLSLVPFLTEQIGKKFHIVRFDLATGLSMSTQTEKTIRDALMHRNPELSKTLGALLAQDQHSPLVMMTYLRDMLTAIDASKDKKPLCIIMPYAEKMFPAGRSTELGELSLQRLVFFLSSIIEASPRMSPHIFVLISPTVTELNSDIWSLPRSATITIELPNDEERRTYVEHFISQHSNLRLQNDVNNFVEASRGLTLSSIRDILVSGVIRKKTVEDITIIAEAKDQIQKLVGDIVRIVYPTHGLEDVIGYKNVQEMLMRTMRRCEDPRMAVPVVLIAGPNGSGKTFIAQAIARQAGRVILELGNIRSEWFGKTDALIEKFRMLINTFGRIMIMVDEAHTAFGSVHSHDTHETEKRLSGKFLSMMSDRALLGKVVWMLMTSRPDQMDPDVISRASIQIPIFDLEGIDRIAYIEELFHRNDIVACREEIEQVAGCTQNYSNRDYGNLTAEILATRMEFPTISLTDVLKLWGASRAIAQERRQQSLIAADHCSYPALIPQWIQNLQHS